jgi:hypothetical protein
LHCKPGESRRRIIRSPLYPLQRRVIALALYIAGQKAVHHQESDTTLGKKLGPMRDPFKLEPATPIHENHKWCLWRVNRPEDSSDQFTAAVRIVELIGPARVPGKSNFLLRYRRDGHREHPDKQARQQRPHATHISRLSLNYILANQLFDAAA